MSEQISYLPTCDPKLIPLVARISHSLFTPRRAVDTSGRLGSLYDACRDQVLYNSNLNLRVQSPEPRALPYCYVKQCKSDKSHNLLKWYHIHDELRLSVALEIVPSTGVGALNNYSGPINKNTRLLCYNYYSRTEFMSDDDFLSRNTTIPPTLDPLATHIVVFVNWGLIAVAVLQLPPDDDLVKDIDIAIDKLCQDLRHNHTGASLSENDIYYLEKIEQTEVFSNISQLSNTKSIIDFYRYVPRLKADISLHKPYNYNLCPIQYFFRLASGKQYIFNELQPTDRYEIEDYLIQLSIVFKRLTAPIDQDYPNLQKHLKEQLNGLRTRWSCLRHVYKQKIEQLRDVVVRVRRGEISQTKIHQALYDNGEKELRESNDHFNDHLNTVQEKESFIGDLVKKQFKYRNASDYDIKRDDDQQELERKLLGNNKDKRIICSSDNLYRNNPSQWNTLSSQLRKEHEGNDRLRLIYVDFSYCSYKLDQMTVLPLAPTDDTANAPKLATAPSSSSSSLQSSPSEQTSHNQTIVQPLTPTDETTNGSKSAATLSSSSLQQPSHDQIMNILLIGESGVGKSTFINALTNYLQFDKLKQAQNNPTILMPVSFVITVGNDFKEQLVTCGGQDNVSSEDYDHPGQSVTQHCKSYVLTLPDGNGTQRKLRIIDTPGIGDVRGLAQDDVNMEHILSFINNLTHLNAVCILMKPNNARLNVFLRSCFMQLFDLLGPDARDKIMFCFTNARSSFYTPGDTAPLLKQLLHSLPVKGVPFVKRNTFCFDSESFRYLVAVQNKIQFDSQQKEEYEESWNRSSTEAKRFLKEICAAKTTTSLIPGQIKSAKHAQLRISLMVRPMLEAIRNILRNIILQNSPSPALSIELCPRIMKTRTAICSKCPRQFVGFGDFWIVGDSLHVFYNRCRTCLCDRDDHYPVDYQLEYKLDDDQERTSVKDMTRMVDDIYRTSAELGHFLSQAVGASRNDQFLMGFERMIKEENDICADKNPCLLNTALVAELKELKKKYEEMKKKMVAEKASLSVQDMYDRIEGMMIYPMIKSQMVAVKQWEKYMVKYYEYEVPTHPQD